MTNLCEVPQREKGSYQQEIPRSQVIQHHQNSLIEVEKSKTRHILNKAQNQIHQQRIRRRDIWNKKKAQKQLNMEKK